MNVVLAILTSILTLAQLHSMRTADQARELLCTATFQIDDEEIPISEFLGQFRVYMFFMFCLHVAVWVLAFQVSRVEIAVAGCAVSFVEFVLNWETVQYLGEKPFEPLGAARIMVVYRFLAVLHLLAYAGILAGLMGLI